jgi:hypothetical protein
MPLGVTEIKSKVNGARCMLVICAVEISGDVWSVATGNLAPTIVVILEACPFVMVVLSL